MEVFMSNVPSDLTDTRLKSLLTPLIDALGIREWACHKQRKRKIGTITFLYVLDGETFLRQHGELDTGLVDRNGRSRMRPRLVLMDSHVYCKMSTNEFDPFMLKSLQKDALDRRENEDLPEESEHRNVTFTATKLSCGYYAYSETGQLNFSPEVWWSLDNGVAKFLRDRIVVTYKMEHSSLRVEFPYRIIDAVLTSNRSTSLTLTLWEPPRFFHVENTNALLEQLERLHVRLNPIEARSPPKPTRKRLIEVPSGSQSHGEIIGQCLVYQIHTSPVEFRLKVKKLREKGILSIMSYNFPSQPLPNPSFADGLKLFHDAIQEHVTKLKFDILFQVQGLVQNGYILPWTGRDLLIQLSSSSPKVSKRSRIGKANIQSKEYTISSLAIKKLFSQIPFPAPDVEASTFNIDKIMKWLVENESKIQLGLSKELISEKARNNLIMVYKVQVTPTKVSLHGPEPETKNRILRKFEAHVDYFVRVQFCDEDGQDIHFNAKISNEDIYKRFQTFLDNGTQIGGRKYDFLGFSHSSLRSHSAWFMASFVDSNELQTYFLIIKNLGNFGRIYSPARCAARIGQAFSETPFAISLEESSIEHCTIPDIRTLDGKRIFTDGIGWVSQEVVDIIRAALPQWTEATCFQIRWGAAKGMLALDASQPGKRFAVRPSMVKFDSDDTLYLEICDMARKPIPLVLNRQMIKILEDMAIPAEWFLHWQNKELCRIRRITATTFNTAAFLKRRKIAEKLGLARLIRRLESIDLDYKNDRFLCSVVEAVILRELRLLKHKARIPIEEGVTLYGVVDETGFLNEGEIYVTFDETSMIETDYLTLDALEMLVTRSPALHPGDIQLATNRIPSPGHPLRFLRNCIVFSQKGRRDLPSQLSGGDLDGDIYNIIWDQDAVETCERVFEPADYPLVEPKVIDREVKREDMTSFFVEFMKTDNLGLIATRHMILADQRPAGTVDSDCQLLAQLHSTSVDYSKSGVPADMDILRNVKGNRFRPDFLAPAPPTHLQNRTEIMFDAPTKPAADVDDDEDEDSGPRYRYYRSEKILGQLYRAIDERKIWNESVRVSRQNSDESSVWESFMSYVMKQCGMKLDGVWRERYIHKAWNIRYAYEDAIMSACVDYSEHASVGITELEVFTGNIFNKTGIQTCRQRDNSLRLKDEFDRIAAWTEAMIRRRTIASLAAEQYGEGGVDFNGAESDDSKSAALELSIACFSVGCTREISRKNSGWGRQSSKADDNLSFKVVAACCLIKELDFAVKQAEVRGGGYVGVGGRQS